MTIRIDGVDFDVVHISVGEVEKEPAAQRLIQMGKELGLPRIDRIRQILRDGWGLVTEIGPTGRPTVFTDRLEELILVYKPAEPGDMEMPVPQLSADEVRSYALQMLRALYEMTGADTAATKNVAELGDAIGLDDLDRIKHVLRYLASRKLVVVALHWASITALGIEKIEAAMERPSEPAAPYLPPINMINAHTINMAPGAQLMQGRDHLQQSSQTTLDIAELKQALDTIEKLARDLEEADRRQIEGLVALVRAEADRPAPNHGIIRTLLVSLKTVAEMFAGGAAANLATEPAAMAAIIDLAHRLLAHLPT